MDKLVITYINQLLELQETRLRCINLGFSPSRDIKVELDLIKQSKEFMKGVKHGRL